MSEFPEPSGAHDSEQDNGNVGGGVPFIPLSAEEAPSIVGEGKPNFRRSREHRSPFARKPAGDKADTPPRSRASVVKIPNRRGQFVEPLQKLYGTIGIALMPVDPICANAILQSAEKCAVALDELAYKNEAVRRVIYSITQTSAVGAVIIAHFPIILAVVMHHVPAAQRVMGNMGAQFAESVARSMEGNNEQPPEA